MGTEQHRREVEYDLDKPRIARFEHTWKAHHNAVYWCNFKLAQRKGLQFSQTRPHAIALSDTTSDLCRKILCMKTGEELYCKVCQSPRFPRVTLVPNSQHAQKDVLIADSRQSDDRKDEVHEHRETCGSNRVQPTEKSRQFNKDRF